MNEYAFDVKLAAVVRLSARSEKEARKLLTRVLDCIELSRESLDAASNLRLTEISIDVDDEDGPTLFELNGEDYYS